MKFIKWLVNATLSLIIIIGLIVAGLYCLGIKPYIVLSGSMEPTIKTGSVCFINHHYKYDDVKEKDIIAFKMDDTLVTHRVVSITDDGMETKGDANGEKDGNLTTKDNFVGKNVFAIPFVGYGIKAMQTTNGKIIFGTIIVLLLVSAFLFGEADKRKEKNN